MAEVEMDAEPIEEIEVDEFDVEEPDQTFSDDNITDDNGSNTDLEAEVLFQVAHYVDEYGGPASLADVAFEIQEKNTDVHKAMEKAVKAGIPKVEPVIKMLLEEGLIVETEYGGYVTTPEGDKIVQEPQEQEKSLGTYESDKNNGNPEGEGEADEFGVPEDVAEDEGKDEAGVPFISTM